MLAHNSTNGNEFVRGKGRIEVIIGPMFSGKTTELIRRLRRYQIACFKCLVLKYIGDYRYSENDIVTHDKNTFAAIPCKTLGVKLKHFLFNFKCFFFLNGNSSDQKMCFVNVRISLYVNTKIILKKIFFYRNIRVKLWNTMFWELMKDNFFPM